ncbi:leucine-rich repeat receptor-like serine/threonine/tyrosine-protein kinase SOBIR1 [Aristolochia californica]|uniref:leucine-rich repeat receptor-like serine/threonine/tyrosine-protein kinase SOBIR1 n=1 Tax=Aristolochia californica TaxID=171875 RepID=UPI0035D5B962
MGMAAATQILLSLLFLSIACASHGLGPVQSDLDVFVELRKSLGLPGQRPWRYPCASAGIWCWGNRITRIVLESRQLSGFIPPAIGRLTELRQLSLADNKLSFRLPSEIANCRKLQILNLSNNRFSGDIPEEISSLVALRSLDLSRNGFVGSLGFLTYFPNLENLSLADNFFTGKVPQSLRSFRNLRFVNITGNRVHGSFIGETKIEYYNEENNLALPRRYRLAENSSGSTHGSIAPRSSPRSSNRSTAIAPFPGSPKDGKHKKHKRPVAKWVVGLLVGAFAGIFSGILLSLLYRTVMNSIRGRQKVSGLEIFSPLIKRAEDFAFLESEDGLAAMEIVGRGGCGEVYRAELPAGSKMKLIAIKKIITNPPNDGVDLSEEDTKLLGKRMRQIRSEIQTVGHIRHRNLLPLLAHIARPGCHFLVYEFMKNGSLQDVLNQVAAGRRELEWTVRHRIACGIAAGLEYLHLHHSPRIIHRDLKPANILLDDDLEARITDFGLAKALPELNTHMTTSNVVGTLGFIAPEYHQTLQFTDKCDIYSFGVLLAALVMGKLPSDKFFQTTQELSLVKWLRNVMTSDDPKRAIEPKLMGNGYEEQMLLVLKIACFCTAENPKERPNSKDVQTMLTQVKH